MNKIIRFSRLVWQMVIIIMLVNIRIASGQAGNVQTNPIPDDINKILQTSCAGCHGINGKMLPKTKLDLSKWNEYSSEKEAERASAICSVLTKQIMPPKSFRKSHPELIPAKEQVALICKWSESLKPKKAGK